MRNTALAAAALVLFVIALVTPAGALQVGGGSYSESWGAYVFAELQGTVPGLVTVDMSYPNAEHNVKALICHPFASGWPELMLTLHDRHRDDPHQGTILWGDLTPYPVLGTHEVSTTSCKGSCRLTIPRLAWNEAFVLAGFSFQFRPTSFFPDARVEEIMVRPRPYSGWIDVAFDNGLQQPFDVSIAYVRIPISAVAGFDSMTSQVAVRGSMTSTRTPGPAVLQGFYLGFADGAGRHLNRFAVDLRNNNLITLRWRDLAGDDFFNWQASWLRLAY